MVSLFSTCGGGLNANPPVTSAPWVAASPTSLNFGSISMGSSSTAQVVTVSNSGTALLKVNSITVDNSAFVLSTPVLPLSVAPAQSFQISVKFTPSTTSSESGWLSISSNTSASPDSLALSGKGATKATPQISVSPSSLGFGSETVGVTSGAKALTVTNTGAVNATISSISVDSTDFAVSTPPLPLTLAPSKSFEAKVTFKPASSGAVSGWVSVYSNAEYSPDSIAVSGTGVAASSGTVSASPSSLTFSNQTMGVESPIQTITVSNTGTGSVTISGLSITPSQFILVSSPALPIALAAGKTTSFSVAFTPTAASTVTGSVTLTSNASPSTNSVALSGTGIAATQTLSASPSSLAFGNQTLNVAGASQAITVTNTGTGSVSLTGLSASPAQFTLISPPTLPLALGAGKTASIRVVFTPTVASTVTGSVTITSTASPTTNTVALSGTGVEATESGLNLLTTSLHTGFLQQAYSTSLAVSGGVTPYTWSVSSGALPPGLALSSTTGQITGTPTEDGEFTVGIQATDSTKPTAVGADGTFTLTVAAGVYDQYGGITEQTCSNGTATHFYTQKISGRWWLCTPAGNAFWLRGVYHVDASDTEADYQGVMQDGTACTSSSPASSSSPCSVVVQKYGDAGPTWGPQTVLRLKSMGFNTTAEYSSGYVQPTFTNSSWTSTSDQSNPQKMPFTGLVWPSHYGRNSNPYANPLKDLVGPLNASVYTGLRHAMFDVFDPNFAKWLAGDLGDYTNAEYNWIHSSHSDYLVGMNFDDTDELFGFGAGVDFEALDNGNLVTGMAHAHLGWVVLNTPEAQSSGTDADGNPITYSDTTVYSKQAFSTFMSSRYSGNIALLNAAWGSSYTTFGSAGGWGSGTGLLDENGSHKWVGADPYGLTGETATMQADLNAFLVYFAEQYFSTIKTALHNAAPGVLYLGPTNLGGWGAPARAQILQAAGQYLDIIAISSIPTGCLSCTDDQARIDFMYTNGGDKPWINWEGFLGQPDSYMSPYPPTDTSYPQTSSQAAKGALFQTMVNAQLSAKDTATGTYRIVGYKWWQYYDDRGEESNWGLVTRRDNAYDGKAAVIGVGKDSWGFPTGGELGSYGDFLDDVTGANIGVYKTLLGLP